MSRAIKLTCIHAINWYGYNDSLPVKGNLLLAGVTGSGKSVLMDLIMTVLVGTDAAHHHFNRSATGGQSDRTVKSYCLLDTKREKNGVPQYIRSAAITYIALEFSWPRKATEEARIETWGLRIEFRNTGENQGHVKPFVVFGPLTKADFLNAERRPLEAAEFKHLVEKDRDGRLFETQDQYLRDMANDQHLNFNRAVLSSLLPQAMSFTNLKSFDEFCRRFILPDDQLNVADVVASYRNFKAYENDLRALFDQQTRLETIRDLHRELAAENSDGRHTGKLGEILNRVTGGKLQCLEDVGISASPRFVLVHGPLRLLFQDGWLDLGVLRGPVRLSDSDINRVSRIETSALRCLTVENETSFHELAKLESGEILVCTSYPGSATLAFLKKLPNTLQFWHFGDSDPEGFDILRDLRERSDRPFRALHMKWRSAATVEHLKPSERRLLQALIGSSLMQTEQESLRKILNEGTKGSFEQESLGSPKHRKWPFYD